MATYPSFKFFALRFTHVAQKFAIISVVLWLLLVFLAGWVGLGVGSAIAQDSVSPSGLVNAMLFREQIPRVSNDPVLKVVGSASEAAVVYEAVDRYADLGLMLPDLQVTFTNDVLCDTYYGWFKTHGLSWQIFVCRTEMADPTRVLMHELSHAWSYATFSDEDKTAALDLFGLEFWQGDDVVYAERGTERLAYLMERVLFEDFWLDDGEFLGPSSELLLFSAVTGVSSDRVFEILSSEVLDSKDSFDHSSSAPLPAFPVLVKDGF